jgi:hypothetical protein
LIEVADWPKPIWLGHRAALTESGTAATGSGSEARPRRNRRAGALISAVVVYRVEDTRRAALDVENFRRFIEDQAGAVIKRVSAQFPYESAEQGQPCLKKENELVTQCFMEELQKAVSPAGIRGLARLALLRLNKLQRHRCTPAVLREFQ